MEQCKDLARRIAELRDICGYTREELAHDLGVDPEVYAGYEENGEDIPISVIFHIANKFGIDFTELLTGDTARLDTFHVVKNGHGRSVDRYPGYSFEDLAFRYSKKIMQPLLVRLEPSDEPAALVRHDGQEFNYVLEGSVVLVFEDKEIILEKGDCVYFNPNHSHGQKCRGDQPAMFLTVIAE